MMIVIILMIIIVISQVESVQDQYITRHLPDGRIIYADHRIATIAGYLPGEVADHDHILIRFDPKCYIQLFTSGIVFKFAAIKFWYLVLHMKEEQL